MSKLWEGETYRSENRFACLRLPNDGLTCDRTLWLKSVSDAGVDHRFTMNPRSRSVTLPDSIQKTGSDTIGAETRECRNVIAIPSPSQMQSCAPHES